MPANDRLRYSAYELHMNHKIASWHANNSVVYDAHTEGIETAMSDVEGYLIESREGPHKG